MAKETAPPKGPNLAALLAGGRVHEDQERDALQSFQKSYLNIVSKLTDPVLKADKPEYIKGAKLLNYVIPSSKINLGANPIVTVVGMFKVYEERKVVPQGSKELPPLIRYWHPLDAEQIKLEGSFERPFLAKGRNGAPDEMHVLKPVHWLCVWIEKHPDIEDGLLTFKSKGNQIYQNIVKAIKASDVQYAPQLKIKLKTQEIPAPEYNAVYIYPDFEIIEDELNFAVKNVKGVDTPVTVDGGLSEEDMVKVLTLYDRLAKEYADFSMVGRIKDISKLVAGPAEGQKLLSGAKVNKPGTPVVDDDDDAF
jgi:hypothetical protein